MTSELVKRLHLAVFDGDTHGIRATMPTSIGIRNLLEDAASEISRLTLALDGARKDAIEDAAKVLDGAAQEFNRIRDPGMANNARSYANKIRALQHKETEDEG